MRPSGKPALAEVWPGCGRRGNRLLAQGSCPEMLPKTARAEGIGKRKRAIPIRPYAGRGLRAQGALKARSLTLAMPHSTLPSSFQTAMTGSPCSLEDGMQLGLG